jgi:hypothetical protein
VRIRRGTDRLHDLRGRALQPCQPDPATAAAPRPVGRAAPGAGGAAPGFGRAPRPVPRLVLLGRQWCGGEQVNGVGSAARLHAAARVVLYYLFLSSS